MMPQILSTAESQAPATMVVASAGASGREKDEGRTTREQKEELKKEAGNEERGG